MHGRDIRAARMQNQRYAHRFPRPIGQFGSLRTGRRRQTRAHDMRETNPGTLEKQALFEHAADATAAFRTLPCIAT